MLCQLLTHLELFGKKRAPKSRQLSSIHHITYYFTFSFVVLLFKEFLFSSVQSTKRGPKRVVRVRIAIVVVEVEQTGVRTIVVVAPAFEPRVARVRKVGGHKRFLTYFIHWWNQNLLSSFFIFDCQQSSLPVLSNWVFPEIFQGAPERHSSS